MAKRGPAGFVSWTVLLMCAVISPALRAEPQSPPIRKVGLALSGGGARGAAHIGVLKVLERERIAVDYIAGTSFGAVVGALYALGKEAGEIEQIFTQQDWASIFSNAPERRLSPLTERKNFRYLGELAFEGISPELPTGLWGGQKMIEVLHSLTAPGMLAAQNDFDRLPIPFRAVATDLITGKPYLFRRGRMTEALRASVGIPMVFTPVEKDDMLLVDGGLANNLPTDVVRDMGADIILAVDVSAPLLKKNEIRSIVNVMDQSVSLLMAATVERNRQIADLVVRPNLEGYTFDDYRKIPEIIQRGEKEAEKRLAEALALVADLPRRTHSPAQEVPADAIVEAISFQGLKRVHPERLQSDLRSRAGEGVDTETLRGDLGRLYATRLFEHVDCSLEPAGTNRYRLTYLVKEAPPFTIGAGIRYDRDYQFVALMEGTLRQIFGTPSSATISSRFGGIEDHSAALRLIPPQLPFLFVEPKVHLRRRERLDFREGLEVDRFTDERIGGQLSVGATFFRRLEVQLAYRSDRVTINGGTEPNRREDALVLSGLTLRLNRDTLDAQDFPRAGSSLKFQVDKRSKSLGGDLSYSKSQAQVEHYFSTSAKSTFGVRAGVGASREPLPFFDRYYIGGYSFSEGGSLQFPGFHRDELVARQMAILGLSYRRRLFSQPLSFTRAGYLSVHYNSAAVSNRSAAPYEFSFWNGLGVGLALNTLLGPIRLTAAWGEQGRGRFYLSLGPSF